jgi:LmbE family N-acetylglucosaminyl deacetylase
MKVIIAPHPDDEILFALEDLIAGVDEVVYVEEVLGGRDKEAIECAKKFGFRPVFIHGLEGLEVYLNTLGVKDIVITTDDNSHILHRLVYDIVRRVAMKRGYKYIVKKIRINDENLKYIKEIYKSQSWLLKVRKL